jgi:hypothetical protein
MDETATLADAITLYLKDCRLAASKLSIYRVQSFETNLKGHRFLSFA